jgi:hypothetical protein
MSEEKQHGPDTVCYANDGFGYKPLIMCLCGWSSKVGACVTWEEAGADFDEHLAETDER